MNYFVNFIVTVTFIRCMRAQDVTETVEAVVGHSAELPCNVTAEDKDSKLNILAWYKNGSSTAFYSRDLRGGNESTTSPGGRYRLVTAESEGLDKLQIITVRPSDAGVYHCVADFVSSPTHKTFVQLDVIEPPRHLWVIHENGTQVAKTSAGVNVSQNIGPYYVGDTVHLVCVTFGGKPLASISWWSDRRLLKVTSTPISEQRVRSDLMYGPLQREDHGRILTCFGKNNDKTVPLSIDIIIDMILPPELVSLRGETLEGSVGGRVRAGEALSLQCRVLGARPNPPLLWRLGEAQLLNLEQNVTMEPAQRLVVSEIQLVINREYDESRVTCCAPSYRRDDDSYVCAQALPLTVLYRPALQIVVENDLDNNTLAIEKGANVSLSCSYQANPSVFELIWFHKDDITPADSSEKIQPLLQLTNLTEKDAGEYVCAATNDEGLTYSEPIIIDVTWPAYCEDTSIVEYGLGETESINLTCVVKGNPEPSSYRWVVINEAVNTSTMSGKQNTTIITEEATLSYQRPIGTAFNTIFCWGINNVTGKALPHTPCTFQVTDETSPRPPTECTAVRKPNGDIVTTCEKGHDGGMPQKFKFTVNAVDSDEQYVSIINTVPEFWITEQNQEKYKFVIVAFNDKGESDSVVIEKDDIIDNTVPENAVINITTLSLALCGGVALVALAACGLVLCARDADPRPGLPSALADPPLCAYNTEESNCETFHDSDDGSDCNLRRTESFRRAVSRYPSKNFDVRRTSSFHSARYMGDMAEHEPAKCNDVLRHNPHCRVHSLQNISRKRDMDALCDHLVVHLPPETNYNVAKPMNTFYTMPRKMRHKHAKEISDETSEITQTSDGFSLPPPPDEFTSYRAGTKIKDMPSKSTPSYTTIIRKSSGKDYPKQQQQQYNNVIISPMNTVGLPTISGTQGGLYSYPDDEHHMHQDTRRSTGALPSYQSYLSCSKESGL